MAPPQNAGASSCPPSTVLAAPADAAQHNVKVATMQAVPDASRLYELADEVARGEFKIPIAKIIPLDQVQKAHREAENHPAERSF